MPTPLKIDFVSDVSCPWCAIGLSALEQALDRVKGDVKVEMHFQPFELNPQMGPEGQDVGEHLTQKYGSTPAQQEQSDHVDQQAQGADGSWGYQQKQNGDTSIVGWQIQALQSAKLCKDLTVDKAVLKRAMEFLDKVASGSLKATYGYTSPGSSKTLTPVGLLCRYYIDGWGPQNPSFQAGVEFIMKAQMPKDEAEFNMYYYYYATQVLHFNEGDQWHKEWNPRMRDLLIKLQKPQTDPPATAGSWDADRGISGNNWGRLGSTCMCLLSLEVYYRHTPLHRRDAGGLKELERGK